MSTATQAQPLHQRILVWDMPTRVFHWSLATCFAIAWLTAESEAYALVHQISGYLFAALIGFRLVWGFAGSRHARFAGFLRSPATTLRYLGVYLKGKPEHTIGHNPLGAVAIVLMLALGLGIGVTGWMNAGADNETFEEIHEALAHAMLIVVVLHIAGVVVSSILHRENLVRAMVTGYKQGPADAGIRRGHGIMAALLIAALAAFGWSLAQGKLPVLLDPVAASAERGHEGHDHDDDDDD